MNFRTMIVTSKVYKLNIQMKIKWKSVFYYYKLNIIYYLCFVLFKVFRACWNVFHSDKWSCILFCFKKDNYSTTSSFLMFLLDASSGHCSKVNWLGDIFLVLNSPDFYPTILWLWRIWIVSAQSAWPRSWTQYRRRFVI